ncbi:MAG TPA: hypothetical protein VIJ94_15145 [Caulobacteraceae bacterium]
MPGLLNGQLSKAIYAGFRGKLLKGQLWRSVISESGGLDARGDPLSTSPQTWNCQGFVENYDDAYRARAGIPETDSKVNIFAASLPNGVAPLKDDKVKMGIGWWQLRKVGTDPATALWTCQAFECRAPS